MLLYQEMEAAQRCSPLTGSLVDCEFEIILRETIPLFMLSPDRSRPLIDRTFNYGPLPLSNRRTIVWPILLPDMVVPHLAASNSVATINGYRSFCR